MSQRHVFFSENKIAWVYYWSWPSVKNFDHFLWKLTFIRSISVVRIQRSWTACETSSLKAVVVNVRMCSKQQEKWSLFFCRKKPVYHETHDDEQHIYTHRATIPTLDYTVYRAAYVTQDPSLTGVCFTRASARFFQGLKTNLRNPTRLSQ